MSNDCGGTGAMREVRPSPRLKFLYRIYLFMSSGSLVLPLLVPVVLLTAPAVSLFFSVPALIIGSYCTLWIPKFLRLRFCTYSLNSEIISKKGVWIRQTVYGSFTIGSQTSRSSRAGSLTASASQISEFRWKDHSTGRII